MADERTHLHNVMCNLVDEFDNSHAATACAIEEYWQGKDFDYEKVDLGGFSRKYKGSRDYSLFDAFALMAISGRRTVLKEMNDLLDRLPGPSHSRRELASLAAKEAGEAVSVAISDGDLSQIAKEAGEAEVAFRKIREQALSDLNGSGA